MPEIRPCIAESASVSLLQPLTDGRIGALTDAGELLLFGPEACTVLTRLKIAELQPGSQAAAFSSDGSRFVFSQATSKGNAIRLIDIASNTLLRSYATHDNPVQLLRFDPSGEYLIAGTATGRVFLWRTDGTNLIARLSSFPEYTPHLLTPPRQNYVSAAAFSGDLLATAGYGGSVVLTNIRTQANTRRIKPGRARIDALLFADAHRLIAANEEGVILLIPTDGNHPIRRVRTAIGRIFHLALLPDGHYLLAASAFNHIALINLETMEVKNNHYITAPAPIRSMALGNTHTLLVGMESGAVAAVELSPFAEFNRLVAEMRYAEAYALGDAEPVIRDSRKFETLERLFTERYDEAHRALAEERRDDAHRLLDPFALVPSREQKVRTLFNAFDHYPRFRHLVETKRYSSAYGLAHQYPQLQKTPLYMAMERSWEKAFLSAQKLILRGHEPQARRALEEFLTVPDKSPYIRLLLYNKKVLIAFAKALNDRDYVTLKTLTEQEPILRNTPSYRTVMEDADTIVEAIMESISGDAFDRAELLCGDLLHIPHLAHRHDAIARLIEKAKQLAAYYGAEEYAKLFELLDSAPELALLPPAKEAERLWHDMIQRCEEAALRGNTALIKTTLGPLLTLKSRNDKIGNLLRVSYQMQIKYLLSREEAERAGKAIQRYIDIFGIDNETRQLLTLLRRQGETLPLNDMQQQNRPRSLWLTTTHGELPDRLIE